MEKDDIGLECSKIGVYQDILYNFDSIFEYYIIKNINCYIPAVNWCEELLYE